MKSSKNNISAECFTSALNLEWFTSQFAQGFINFTVYYNVNVVYIYKSIYIYDIAASWK